MASKKTSITVGVRNLGKTSADIKNLSKQKTDALKQEQPLFDLKFKPETETKGWTA